jgi:hypothetical protein
MQRFERFWSFRFARPATLANINMKEVRAGWAPSGQRFLGDTPYSTKLHHSVGGRRNAPTVAHGAWLRRYAQGGGAKHAREQRTASRWPSVGVVKVQLYVDGVLTDTSTATPWTRWNTSPKQVAVGAHTLQTKAYDGSSNSGLSSVIPVYK